jgi:hypothetical protein
MMKQKNCMPNLQSITDLLCGYNFHVCEVRQTDEDDSTFEAEEDLLRNVWEIVTIVSPPEPDDAIMERIYRQLCARFAAEEIDDDELDWAVGAAKKPDVDLTSGKKDR